MNSPAFQLYVDDFVGGVSDMTQAEVGAYILLLCHQWSRGEIPTDSSRASRIAKGKVSNHVFSKFPNGKNERMEKVRKEKEAWLVKQAANGRKGMAKRWHNESYNEPITTLSPKDNSPSPSPSPKEESNPFQIPENLKSDKFKDSWNKWLEHLRQKRKQPTILAAEMQLSKLSQMGLDRAIEAIENSIAGNYQGIFEPKQNGNEVKKTSSPRHAGGNF